MSARTFKSSKFKFGSIALALAIAPLFGAHAQGTDNTENFTVIIGGTNVGHLDVVRSGDTVKIDYAYKNNGRVPTRKEELKRDAKGMPVAWKSTGNSTFGNAINEIFTMQRGTARWTVSTGSGTAKPKGDSATFRFSAKKPRYLKPMRPARLAATAQPSARSRVRSGCASMICAKMKFATMETASTATFASPPHA